MLQYCDKNVFGVPFTVMVQRTGQPLPQCVLYAMRYLRKTAQDAVGIFRKSGVRSRIQKLRDLVEANPGENTTDYFFLVLFLNLIRFLHTTRLRKFEDLFYDHCK